MTLLSVENLSIAVGKYPLVQNLSFELDNGQTMGIVGESGCGKSLTSLAIMGLLEDTQIKITDGAIYFNERNLLQMSARERRSLMGSQMAMIFQEPMTSLNPVYRIGDQLIEMIRQHEKISPAGARARAAELLKLVHIPDPNGRLRSYPHQLSGGMRQRVMIAMALACSPSLLIADEPVTALDVTVQAQILALLSELQRDTGMSMILISHDLGVIAQNCQSVAVMYCGRLVETASTNALFAAARHHYTRGLMALIADVQADIDELTAIPGRVPTFNENISGCAFHPRCAQATQLCKEKLPLFDTQNQHMVMCHHPYREAS